MPGFLYSAVTYTLLGCKNVLCSWPIPAHPPTHPACPPPHHLARPPPALPHLARACQPPSQPPGPPPGPTVPQCSPTMPHPVRPPLPHLDPSSPPPSTAFVQCRALATARRLLAGRTTLCLPCVGLGGAWDGRERSVSRYDLFCFDDSCLRKSRSPCSILGQNIDISFGPNAATLGTR